MEVFPMMCACCRQVRQPKLVRQPTPCPHVCAVGTGLGGTPDLRQGDLLATIGAAVQQLDRQARRREAMLTRLLTLVLLGGAALPPPVGGALTPPVAAAEPAAEPEADDASEAASEAESSDSGGAADSPPELDGLSPDEAVELLFQLLGSKQVPPEMEARGPSTEAVVKQKRSQKSGSLRCCAPQ